LVTIPRPSATRERRAQQALVLFSLRDTPGSRPCVGSVLPGGVRLGCTRARRNQQPLNVLENFREFVNSRQDSRSRREEGEEQSLRSGGAPAERPHRQEWPSC
jgi:hypothetical protein